MPVPDFPSPPALVPLTQIRCEVGALVSLGSAPAGERRYVPLGGGTARGPELNGTLVEVKSDGLRHGPAAVMQQLGAARPCRATPASSAR